MYTLIIWECNTRDSRHPVSLYRKRDKDGRVRARERERETKEWREQMRMREGERQRISGRVGERAREMEVGERGGREKNGKSRREIVFASAMSGIRGGKLAYLKKKKRACQSWGLLQNYL